MSAPTMPLDQNGGFVQALRPAAHSTVSVASSSAQSSTFGKAVIRLWSSADCYIEVGSNPTATTSKMPLSAGSEMYMRVVPDEDKIAVIRRSSDGTLHITEMA